MTYLRTQVKRCLENIIEAIDPNALRSFEESSSVTASDTSYLCSNTVRPVLMGSVEAVKRNLQEIAGRYYIFYE